MSLDGATQERTDLEEDFECLAHDGPSAGYIPGSTLPASPGDLDDGLGDCVGGFMADQDSGDPGVDLDYSPDGDDIKERTLTIDLREETRRIAVLEVQAAEFGDRINDLESYRLGTASGDKAHMVTYPDTLILGIMDRISALEEIARQGKRRSWWKFWDRG